ncbi:MAG: hypothetical protein ABI402_01845 [Ferruginibacter sp.]
MRKLLFLLLLTVSFSYSSRSQYITIPDAGFQSFLQQQYPSCFNGAGLMDTTCSTILNATTLNVYTNVADWEGFQYFRNLQTLYIGGMITTLPDLPATLLNLDLSGGSYNITSLPTLPAGLKRLNVNSAYHLLSLPATLPATLVQLDCSNCDLLTALPPLPATLVNLDCSRNKLTSLPTLPASLDTLDCSFNDSLAVLPALPNGLVYLNCQVCNIGSIGTTLPPSLVYLDFNNNKVAYLPALPVGLKTLYGVSNLITALPSSFPNGLETIYMNNNQFSNIPALPPTLVMFGVGNNHVSSLPALPNSITYFDCSDNLLTNLPVLPTSLESFFCGSNLLTSLPAIPPHVTDMRCTLNQLVSLPQLPDTLNNLWVDNNPLGSLPALPSHLESLSCGHTNIAFLPALPQSLNNLTCSNNANLHCLPVLPNGFITIDMDNRINCMPNSPSNYIFDVRDTSGFNILTYSSGYGQLHFPLCSAVTNSYHCDAFPLMTGHVYNDNNNNGVKDANEPYRANVKVTLSDGTFTTTNNAGEYAIAADSIGNYSLALNPLNYYSVVPTSYNYNFSNYDTLVTNNFALQANATADSLTISVTPLSWAARIGHPMPYIIHYENSGTTTLAPVINFNYNNSQLVYDSSSNAAVISNTNSLQLNETNMVSGESRSFFAYFTVAATAVLGDTVRVHAHAGAGTATAVDSAANQVRGPFDPNDKSATPALTPDQVANGEYINYNIRFQNTGNDTAFNVVLTDTLSSYLKASTLEVVNASHTCKTTVKGKVVYFEFLNIMLPDSNVNEMKSHGFVSFKIKPENTVAVNTSIPNQAAIYFDYNLPVLTNTAVTEIQDLIVVPLKLLSFNVERQTKTTANAYWATANEDHVRDFAIEVSTNGRDYSAIASENSKGNLYNNYAKVVSVPTASIVYYRLKITDIDGRFFYGPVVILKANAESTGFSFQNNPVKDKLIVSVEDPSLINSMARIINTQGSIIQKIYFKNDPEVININSLPAGTYMLETIKGTKQFVVIK